jgi:Flp pilus assembly protein TadB
MPLTSAERRFIRSWEEQRNGGRPAFVALYTMAYFFVAFLCSVALALFLSLPVIKIVWLVAIAVFSLVLAFGLASLSWKQKQKRFSGIIRRETYHTPV